MPFFKSRKGGDESAAAARQPESIEAMRKRAKHRLIGAGVLVLAGVVGFPLLFDTQPRPVAVDIPIEIPDRNKVQPLPPLPPAPAPAAAPVATGKVMPLPEAAPVASAAAPVPESKVEPTPAPVQKAETRPAPVEKVAKAEPSEKKPESKAETKATEAAKARALLDGRSVSTGEAAG